MRCQKVRSYLSAYCNDELIGEKRLALDTHLAGCAACRKEEAAYRLLHLTKAEIPIMKVSADFNNKLLNRIGQERFAETRTKTKAYLPTNPPLFAWNKVVPAVVSACLLIITAVALIGSQQGFNNQNDGYAVTPVNANNAYLYVQPTNNPNVNTQLADDWSFGKQLARSERINSLSRDITDNSPLIHNVSFNTRPAANRTPYLPEHSQMRPVVRIFIVPQPSVGKGGTGEY